MNFAWFWSLSVGLTRDLGSQRSNRHALHGNYVFEPQAAITCRRNILVLSATLVVAGSAGVDPRDLELLGMKPLEDRAVIVFGMAAVSAHLYWYFMRYRHLVDDGEFEQLPAAAGERKLRLPVAPKERMQRKSADVVANWAAVLLTVLAWAFVGFWMLDALLG